MIILFCRRCMEGMRMFGAGISVVLSDATGHWNINTGIHSRYGGINYFFNGELWQWHFLEKTRSLERKMHRDRRFEAQDSWNRRNTMRHCSCVSVAHDPVNSTSNNLEVVGPCWLPMKNQCQLAGTEKLSDGWNFNTYNGSKFWVIRIGTELVSP